MLVFISNDFPRRFYPTRVSLKLLDTAHLSLHVFEEFCAHFLLETETESSIDVMKRMSVFTFSRLQILDVLSSSFKNDKNRKDPTLVVFLIHN